MKLLAGLVLIAIGILILRFRYQIYNFTGDWAWAEEYLGGNGTLNAISLIGAFMIAAGAAFPFGAFDRESMMAVTSSSSSAGR